MRGGLTRRRVQTTVIGLVLLVSTGASVLGLALAADSYAPFDQAFAAQRGADVVAAVDSGPGHAGRAGRDHPAAAGDRGRRAVRRGHQHAPGGAAPPAPGRPCLAAQALPPLTLAGRASPGGPVDDVTLQSGHWARRPGQLVLSSTEVYPEGDLPQGVGLGTQPHRDRPARESAADRRRHRHLGHRLG